MIIEPPRMQTPEKIIRWEKEPWSCGMSAPWIGRLVKPLCIAVSRFPGRRETVTYPNPITV
jgi:predicted DNA-binding transcriptional regulator AlpA